MVKKGDIVDIIFPATSSSAPEILNIKKYVRNLGLEPRILLEKLTTPRKNLSCNLANFSAQNRFEQLYQALENSDSKLVWCAQGGYSSGDLLPYLAQAKPLKQNKIFVGFSDITSIATFLEQNWNWQIICGPMLIQLIENGKLMVNKKSAKEILDLIFHRKNHLEYSLTNLNQIKFKNNQAAISGQISGQISGGCLSVLCGHFGGQFQINCADKILFLEDIEENGEKLDRYFRQIIEMILFSQKKPQAIILGEFCYGIKDRFLKINIDSAIKNLISRIEKSGLEIPVFMAQDPLGHSNKMRPLVLGSQASLIKKNSSQTQLIIPKIL